MKSPIRFRPLMAVVGVLMIAGASEEISWSGFLDRAMQFGLACVAFHFAIPADKEAGR